MKIIDFRIRPPFGSFLQAIMYRDPARTEDFSRRVGMYQAASVGKQSLELMIAEMDAAGVGLGVVPGRKANPQLGMVANEDIAVLLAKYPGRFVGFAGIDPSTGDDACQEIDATAVNGPFRGIVLEPGVLAEPMQADDRRIYPVYEQCAGKGIPVMIMVGANCGPDVSYSLPVALEHVATDFPRLKIIVAHGGWPWVTQTLQVAIRRPNVYISPDMYMVNMPGFQDYVTAANYFLQDRFLYASSYPFIPLAAGVEYFCGLPFKPEVLPKLLHENAAALLGLDRTE